MIELINCTKIYNNSTIKLTALNAVSLKLANNGIIGISGKSGSGKSTLLNIIGGLDKPDSGCVYYDGVSSKDFSGSDFDKLRSSYIGFIFQEFNLLDDLDVYNNIKLALSIQGCGKKEIEEKINAVLKKLDISDIKDRKITEISGGQKQRVAIARVLVKGCKVILADEPTGNLDEENAKNIYELLKKLSKDILVVLVSHDSVALKQYSDRLVYINDGIISQNDEENDGNLQYSNQDLKLNKNRLSIKSTLFLAKRFNSKKRFKLITTLLMLTINLIIFAVAFNFAVLDTARVTGNIFKEQGIDNLTFNRHENETEFTQAYINNLEKEFDSILFYKSYQAVGLDLFSLGLIYSRPQAPDILDDFYKIDINQFRITKDPKNILFGNRQLSDNQIAISDYLADCIIYYGLTANQNDFPQSMQQLVGMDISFNNKALKIGQIIKTDYQDFLKLVDDDFSFYENKQLVYKFKQNYSVVCLSQAAFEKSFADSDFIDTDASLYIDIKNDTDLYSFIKYTQNNKLVYDSFVAEYANWTTNFIGTVKNLALVVALVLAFIVIIFYNNTISSLINGNKRDLGVIRALGGKRADILKVFFVQSGIIAFISFVATIAVSTVVINILNNYIAKSIKDLIDAKIIYYSMWTVLTVLAINILITVASVFFPVYKLSKKKPIDVILEKY